MRNILSRAGAGALLVLMVSGCSMTSAPGPLAFTSESATRKVPAGAYLAGASPGAAMGGNLHVLHKSR